MKQVDCNFNLNLTTEDGDKLPNPRQMKYELEELFENVLDDYLSKLEVGSNEVHLILGDELTIDEFQ